MRNFCILTFILLQTPSIVQAADRKHYTISTNGNPKAGEMTIEFVADGWIRTSYHFKDNGRGPDLNEEFKLAADGSLQEYQVKGTSTFGSHVDEQFSRNGQTARWQSAADSGRKELPGPGFYVPSGGTSAVTSTWISALASFKDGLPLLPSGFLRQRKLDELTLRLGKQQERVQLLALEGLGMRPWFVWATTGRKPELFAVIEPGNFYLLPDGWLAGSAQLEERQKAAEGKALEYMAATLAEPLEELAVVRNARLFDSEKAELTAPSDVYFKKGMITAVLPAGSVPQGSITEIDASGQVLLPGLFDMHGHFGSWDGPLHLAAGVTSVRDLGNDNKLLQEYIGQIENHRLLGPQIIPAGFLEGESPYSARLGFQIKDLKQAKAAVDWYAQNGYPQLKIYNSFPKEILRETVAYAHSHGMRVSGHVPAFLKAHDVVEQGFDEVQHINQLMLNFFVKPDTDTRTLQRFYLVAEKAADLDLDSKEVQDFIAFLVEHKTVIDPTLTAFDFLRHRSGTIPDSYAAIFDHLPVNVQRDYRQADMDIPNEEVANRNEKSFAKLLEFTARMYKAGVPVVAGTDAIPGFTLQSELEHYVKAGLTPVQALQIATKNGALYSRAYDRGVIAPGKRADLVLIDGDPTKHIGDLRKVSLVISQGRVFHPDQLYKSLGIKPFDVKTPHIVRPLTAMKVSKK